MLYLNNVIFDYFHNTPREIKVLRGVSFSINQGEFISLIGNSGSGKSTLARIISGLLKPSGGSLSWLSTSNALDTCNHKREAGLILQNPENQIITDSVEAEVAFGLECQGIPKQDIRSLVEYILKKYNLWDKKDHSPKILSGGEKQKLAIASMLILKPKCLILDEPTALLDYQSKKQVIDTITKLHQEDNVSIILITSVAEELLHSKRVLFLDQGIIGFDGLVSDLFNQRWIMEKTGIELTPALEISRVLKDKGRLKETIYESEELIQKILWEYQLRT